MDMAFTLELHLLMYIRMKTTTSASVGGTFIVVVQHCTQDHLTTTGAKNMDQGKEMEDMFTQETV